MEISSSLLQKMKIAAGKNFESYLVRIFSASVDHGEFGMQMVDRLHSQLPVTSCGNCGRCCNSVSFFSLEYHRIIREIMADWSPEDLRRLVRSAFQLDLRQTEINGEKRLRCIFRDEAAKKCLIHQVRPFPCRFFGLLKENGKRECNNVRDLNLPERTVSEGYLTSLQAKIFENSESYKPFEGKDEIQFFPFEFWFFRHIFSSTSALQIYREILVPMSTPLIKLWEQN